MEINKILIAAIAIIALLNAITLIVVANDKGEAPLGSATHFSGPIDSEEGFTVDDTTRIDGSGAGTFTTSTLGSLFINGTSFATTVRGAGTTTAAEVCAGHSLFLVTPGNAGNNILYLPATTTLYADCLTQTGSMFSLQVYNTTTTGAGTGEITITRPSWVTPQYGGIVLQGVSSTDAFTITGGEIATVRFTRVSDTTTTVQVINGQR